MSHQKPVTISTAYDIFMLDAESRRFTQTTLAFYRHRLTAFIHWCHENSITHLQDITAHHIRSYFVHMQQRNLSDWSQNAAGRAIKTFLSRSVDEGLLSESPAKRVKLPKIAKHIPPALTDDQVRQLLRATVLERDKTIILFLLDTGVRNAELVKLNGGDVDMKTGVVTVSLGKGQKDRIVYVGAKTRKQLLRYFAQTRTPGSNDHLWIGASGNRLTNHGLDQLFQRLSAQSGVKVTPHTLRRTFALNCLRNGMNIYVLARLMGHTDIVVLRRYLDLVEDDLQGAHKGASPVDNMK